jgi:hypothetical protein
LGHTRFDFLCLLFFGQAIVVLGQLANPLLRPTAGQPLPFSSLDPQPILDAQSRHALEIAQVGR